MTHILFEDRKRKVFEILEHLPAKEKVHVSIHTLLKNQLEKKIFKGSLSYIGVAAILFM